MASNEPDLSDDIAKEAERKFKESGFAGVTRFLSVRLDKWKKLPLKIAVIGNTKSGISSFINAIRGLSPRDKGAAKVGVCQVTTENTEYPSPDNANLVYVDVPGVGTPSFPRETYLEIIKIDQFDFYIILSCDTFTENDAWLVNEIKKRGKNFLFLRTKIDIDLRNQEDDYEDTYNEIETLEMIRKNCADHLKGIEERHIYLVSNKHISRWEFPLVRETLIRDFPEMKQDALLLSLRLVAGDTRNMILLKKKALKRRAAIISTLSAVGGAIPIPGVSVFVDLPIILEETYFYRRQLGLNSASIRSLSVQSGIALVSLRTIASTATKYSLDIVLKMFAQLAGGFIGRAAIKVLPIIGSIVGGVLSYGLCVKILFKILNDYTDVALLIHEYIYEHLRGQKCDANDFMDRKKRQMGEIAGDVTKDNVASAEDAMGSDYLQVDPTANVETALEHDSSEETASLWDQNMLMGEIARVATEDNVESAENAKRSDELREASTEIDEKAFGHVEDKGSTRESASPRDQT